MCWHQKLIYLKINVVSRVKNYFSWGPFNYGTPAMQLYTFPQIIYISSIHFLYTFPHFSMIIKVLGNVLWIQVDALILIAPNDRESLGIQNFIKTIIISDLQIRNYSFSMNATFSVKQPFLVPWHKEILVFGKFCVLAKCMIPKKTWSKGSDSNPDAEQTVGVNGWI